MALLAAVPAWAQVPPARDITKFACPPGQVPEDGFGDVTADNTHETAIDCVAWYGVTSGVTANAYGPANPVPRAQMASFIARLIDYVAIRTPSTTDGLPAAPSTNAFPCDVAPGTHYESIQRLAAAGIVDGTIDTASVGGCGISPPKVFDIDNPAGAATLAFTVAIPAGQGGIACRLDVITTFVGGGRATSSAVISVTPS